jgi:hypothetical protein
MAVSAGEPARGSRIEGRMKGYLSYMGLTIRAVVASIGIG